MEVWQELAENIEKGTKRLVDEYWKRLYGAAVALDVDENAAEDLVFRTFATAVEKISQFCSKYSFWNWLYAIMLNNFRDDLRKKKAEVPDDLAAFEAAAEQQTISPFESMQPIDAAFVRSAVSRLPAMLREAVVLRYFEDKTLAEMSQLMAIPVGTVKSRLSLARTRLRRSLCHEFRDKGRSTR